MFARSYQKPQQLCDCLRQQSFHRACPGGMSTDELNALRIAWKATSVDAATKWILNDVATSLGHDVDGLGFVDVMTNSTRHTYAIHRFCRTHHAKIACDWQPMLLRSNQRRDNRLPINPSRLHHEQSDATEFSVTSRLLNTQSPRTG